MYRSASRFTGGGIVALEQHRLPRLRTALEDFLDVRAEADVEHPVGLVEDDEPHVAEDQGPAADQVQHPPWRADDEGGPLGELLGLLADRLAAVDGDDVDVPPFGQLDALVADLDGQFAGGHQHDRLRRGRLAVRLQPLEDRDGEGSRLARARLRLAHHVHIRHSAGYQSPLNGSWFEIIRPQQGLEHDFREP